MPAVVLSRKLTPENAISELEEAAAGDGASFFELPNGKHIVVFPMVDFESLHCMFRNPLFMELLGQAVDDLKHGRVVSVNDQTLPKPKG